MKMSSWLHRLRSIPLCRRPALTSPRRSARLRAESLEERWVPAAPVAEDDAVTFAEDSFSHVIEVLTNDSDPDGDTLSIQNFTQPANGFVFNTFGGTVVYSPNSNFSGIDTFTYTISDGHSGTDTATVTITVTPVADPPIAVGETLLIPVDSPATAIDVLANDSDPDGDTLLITQANAGFSGGTVEVTGGGTGLTYQPAPGFRGNAAVNYTVSDGNGGIASGFVTLLVVGSTFDYFPSAKDDFLTVVEDSPATAIEVLSNDHDADGDALTIIAATQPQNGTVVITGGGSGLTFQPDPDVNSSSGFTDFTYTVSDGKGGIATAHVSINVTAVGDPPVAADDTATVAVNGAPAAIPVLANDTDVDLFQFLLVTAVTQPANGTVVLSASGTGLTYQPHAGFEGTDTFTYTVSDGLLGTGTGTDTGTVTVTVSSALINAAPTVADDTASIIGFGPIEGVLANDSDSDGDPLAIIATSMPAHGLVFITNGDTGLNYTATTGFAGEDSFTYTVSDGKGGVATATVTVTILPAGTNLPPIARDDTATVTVNPFPSFLSPLSNDTDPNADPLTITDVGQPANGTATISGTSGIQYQPNTGFTGTETITYTVSDGHGGTASATITVTVQAAPPNTPPVAGDDAATVSEDSLVVIDVLANDTDPDGDPLFLNSLPTAAGHGTVLIYQDRLFYHPDPGFSGSDSFSYRINDLLGGFTTATVTVTVSPISDAPVARDDMATLPKDSPATAIDVLGNDSDGDGDPLTITTVTQPANGTVVITGSGSGLTYQPNAGFSGPDDFTYTINDGDETDTATVSVFVGVPPNAPPTAADDTATVAEDSPATGIDVLGNDTDADTDPLTITAVAQPANGTVAIIGGGSLLTYQPRAGFSGPETFTYEISDGNGGSDTATVTVTVMAVNDAPDAVSDAATVDEGSGETLIAVLANDTDAEGNALTITAVGTPDQGGTAVASGGKIRYTPAAGFSGTESFTYAISDGNGGTNTATVTVTVTPSTSPPTSPPPTTSPPPSTGGSVELPRTLSVSGLVFTPDANGQYSPAAITSPFASLGPNVRSATADVDGDGTADAIYITGPGPQIRFAIMSGAGNSPLLLPTAPFAGSEDFTGGGFVSAADFNGDGRAEIVITPDQGGGPRVAIFSIQDDGSLDLRANFFGIDDPNFRGGARTGAGDINNDGVPDLAVAAGFQGGPRIALFDGTTLTSTRDKIINDFFAFEGGLRNGAYVAIGDFDGDGFGDLLFGAGPGGAPRLLAISGQQLLTNGPESAIAGPLANFFVAGNANDRGGVRVAAKDADGDDRADLIVGSGEGSPASVRIYLGKNFSGRGEPEQVQNLDIFDGAVLTDGVFVG